MNSRIDKRKKNNLEDKRAAGRFFSILLASTLLGGVIGGFMGGLAMSLYSEGVSFTQFWNGLQNQIADMAVYGLVGGDVILLAVSCCLYLDAKKKFRLWDGEDEERIEAIEKRLTLSMMFSNILSICSVIFFGLSIYNYVEDEKHLFSLYGLVLFFVAATGFLVALQRLTINLEKEINPEKKGSALDFNFRKKWVESCDEAERTKLYKCGYRAFNAANKACTFLSAILIVTGTLFEISQLPLIIVGFIWITLVVSYCLESL